MSEGLWCFWLKDWTAFCRVHGDICVAGNCEGWTGVCCRRVGRNDYIIIGGCEKFGQRRRHNDRKADVHCGASRSVSSSASFWGLRRSAVGAGMLGDKLETKSRAQLSFDTNEVRSIKAVEIKSPIRGDAKNFKRWQNLRRPVYEWYE